MHTPEPNFPMLRVLVFFSLLSGAILSLVSGDLHTAELPMLYQMFSQLAPNEILIADRGFGNFVLLALLGHGKPGVDFIGRSARQVDGRRRLKRLGRDDWLVVWKKGTNPSLWLPELIWLALPKEITVRIVRGSCYVKGFRVRQVTLVTTLRNVALYSRMNPSLPNACCRFFHVRASLPVPLCPSSTNTRFALPSDSNGTLTRLVQNLAPRGAAVRRGV